MSATPPAVPTAVSMHNPHHWYEFGPTRAPGLLRLALEWRAPWEYGVALLAQPLLAQAPAGDGHPVLIFPGMMASDTSTKPLRRYLEARGYVAAGWDLGSNLGPRDGVVDRCRALLKQLRRQHRRRVSLIGWSLGGIYARELAKENPKDVRLVITLGTPFTGHPKATNAWRLYEIVTGHRIGAPEIHEPLRAPPPVPTTSIYSRSDGIVAWQCSVEHPSPLSENIEVEASHFGLGLNPLAWWAIADRLAQPEGKWQPFDRTGGWREWLYRDPQRRAWF
jgi:pimeloyl-ACP methyl ester carboxylesterase